MTTITAAYTKFLTVPAPRAGLWRPDSGPGPLMGSWVRVSGCVRFCGGCVRFCGGCVRFVGWCRARVGGETFSRGGRGVRGRGCRGDAFACVHFGRSGAFIVLHVCTKEPTQARGVRVHRIGGPGPTHAAGVNASERWRTQGVNASERKGERGCVRVLAAARRPVTLAGVQAA